MNLIQLAELEENVKARADARNIVGQQDATLLGPTCCERLHTMLCVVDCCCYVVLLLFDQFQTSSNNFQQVATTLNNTQHGVQTLATCWAQQCCVLLPNNVASVCTSLKAWFPYRCICRICRVSRTKKIHGTDITLSLVSISLYLSYLSCLSYEKNS